MKVFVFRMTLIVMGKEGRQNQYWEGKRKKKEAEGGKIKRPRKEGGIVRRQKGENEKDI